MRLHFDYNEVSPEVIKKAVDFFYNEYKRDHLQFGAVSLYVIVRRKEDNAAIGWYDDKGNERELYIKHRPLKASTKKQLLTTLVSDESEETDPIGYVYLK